MKRLLVICLLLMPLFNLVDVLAEGLEEPDTEPIGCILEIDENGVILNLEEYEECLLNSVEPTDGGKDRGPRQ